MFTPSAAMRSIFSTAAEGTEKSIATSTPLKLSAVMPSKFALLNSSSLSAISMTALCGDPFDQPAHFAVSDNGELHSKTSGSSSRKNSLCSDSTARARSFSATTTLRFSSDAPCEIIRILTASSEREDAGCHSRSVSDVLSHQTDDRLLGFNRDFRKLTQFLADPRHLRRCCRW